MKRVVAACLASFSLSPTLVMGQMDIFTDPENLEVLPSDISPQELSAMMKSFAVGLGVRCENCHVGEAGKPLSTFDFAADDREMKKKARTMIRMVNAINADYISELDEVAPSDHGARVTVGCVTCHRGVQLPKMTAEVLNDTLGADGLEAALAKYGELREQYYGTHSYDFEEYMLPFYAQELAENKQLAESIAFLKLNAQHFPESSYTFFALGEISQLAGETDAAITNYKRAAELDPGMADYLNNKIKALTSSSSDR